MISLKVILTLCLTVGLASADERQKRQAYGGQYEGNAAYRQPQGYQQQQQQQGQSYGHQPAAQYAPQQPAQRPHRHQSQPEDDEEKEQGPHPLNLLLENSKFECGSKSDGYYADSDVGCQAFHYCVSGHKHSMMCPEGTVFHQVHLNCVPRDQDICSKADKFFFVNDYLNKPLEKGPNNTIVYAQRYYPDNYANGDPFVPPQESKRDPPAATYGLGPAYREQQPAPVQQPQVHRQQPPRQQAYAPVQQAPAAYARPQPAAAQRPQSAPYAPPQAYNARQQVPPQHARPDPYQQPPPPQVQVYGGYGAEQAHLAQAQQAQRAYAQQQQQALGGPQQHLYGAGAGQRPRYAQY